MPRSASPASLVSTSDQDAAHSDDDRPKEDLRRALTTATLRSQNSSQSVQKSRKLNSASWQRRTKVGWRGFADLSLTPDRRARPDPRRAPFCAERTDRVGTEDGGSSFPLQRQQRRVG